MTEKTSGDIRSHINKTSMLELADNILDATARIEQIIWLPGAIGDGSSLAQPLRDLLEETDEELHRCFGKLPDWLMRVLHNKDGKEAFAEWANSAGKAGFVIQIATPVMTPHAYGASFSWGHYRTEWIYGDTIIDAVSIGLNWVEQCRREEGTLIQPEGSNAK